MGWFWADEVKRVDTEIKVVANDNQAAKCPVDHKKFIKERERANKKDEAWFSWGGKDSDSVKKVEHDSLSSGKCPVDHSKFRKEGDKGDNSWWTSNFGGESKNNNSNSNHAPAEVIPHQQPTSSWWPFSKSSVSEPSNDHINPLNNMPDLSSQRAPGQKIALPTERTLSSIPKGTNDQDGVWEYPSPQQMLNAMLRKSGGEIPEDAVESMVDVHNFLNEGAWDEILKWEAPHTKKSAINPRLLKFTGRPDDLSPRAQLLQFLGKIYPSKYGTQLPFDRHDWTVLRASDKGEWREVRYVIDYYAGPDNSDGMPTFILDVRPALDSVSSAIDRVDRVSDGILSKAMGWDK